MKTHYFIMSLSAILALSVMILIKYIPFELLLRSIVASILLLAIMSIVSIILPLISVIVIFTFPFTLFISIFPDFYNDSPKQDTHK